MRTKKVALKTGGSNKKRESERKKLLLSIFHCVKITRKQEENKNDRMREYYESLPKASVCIDEYHKQCQKLNKSKLLFVHTSSTTERNNNAIIIHRANILLANGLLQTKKLQE